MTIFLRPLFTALLISAFGVAIHFATPDTFGKLSVTSGFLLLLVLGFIAVWVGERTLHVDSYLLAVVIGGVASLCVALSCDIVSDVSVEIAKLLGPRQLSSAIAGLYWAGIVATLLTITLVISATRQPEKKDRVA